MKPSLVVMWTYLSHLMGQQHPKKNFGVKFHLEDALGCPVDLVTEKALCQELRPFIEPEAVSV